MERFRHDTEELQRLTDAVDSEVDLAELRESAETAAETGRALASRQEEALDTLREDLLSSPEIVRWVSWLAIGGQVRLWEAVFRTALRFISIVLHARDLLAPSSSSSSWSP